MIRTRKPDQKKLCPRCGSPMMLRENGVKYCPVCHYTETAQKTEVTIKITETEVKKELPKIEIYQVSVSGVNKVPNLDSKFAYLIADRNSNTIWIWKGAQCSPGEAYKASVESTKLKSSLKLYSASIIRIEEGEEPETFPKIGAKHEAMERDRLKKEEEDLKQQEEMRKRKEEELSKRKEADALRQKEQESRKLKEEENRKREMEAERKRKEDEELRLKEEEARRRKEEEDRKRKMEAERKRKEDEELHLKEEETRRQKEEELRLKKEQERKRKEEEDRLLSEKAAREHKEEAERRLREEADRRAREKPVSAIDLLQKPEPEAKPPPEVEEEIDISKNAEMKEAISSLTLIRGVTKEIAIKLFKVNISTIMELSLSDPENLTASGISLDSLKQIIRNAKDLLGLD